MPVEVLSLFFATACLLAVTPGPDNIFVLSQSLAYGSRAGILVTLGLCTGLMVHTSLVAAGLAAVIAASPALLWVIRLFGVAYLLYLAWLHWNTAARVNGNAEVSHLGAAQLYRRGIIMNVTNPKVGLFFIAFLPQFIQPVGASVGMQVMWLGLLFMVSTLLVFGGIALVSGAYSHMLTASPGRQCWMNRLVSLVFIALAVNLLVFTR